MKSYKIYDYAGGDDGITREELNDQVFDTPTEAWFSVGFSTHAHSDVAVEDTATGLPVSDSIFQAGKPKVTHITLPAGVLCCYIEMNGRTYYLDDSTSEQIMNNWEEDQPCD